MQKIFIAEIVVDTFEDQDVLVFRGYFSTAEKAEAAIAVEQAKIAPEECWNNDAFGNSYLDKDATDEHYYASITAVELDKGV